MFTEPTATNPTPAEDNIDEAAQALVERIRAVLAKKGVEASAQNVTRVAFKVAQDKGHNRRPDFRQRMMAVNTAALKAAAVDNGGAGADQSVIGNTKAFLADMGTSAVGGAAAAGQLLPDALVQAYTGDPNYTRKAGRDDLNAVRQDVAGRHGRVGNTVMGLSAAAPAIGAAALAAAAAPAIAPAGAALATTAAAAIPELAAQAPVIGAGTHAALFASPTALGVLSAGATAAAATVPELVLSKADALAEVPESAVPGGEAPMSPNMKSLNLLGTAGLATAANFVSPGLLPAFGKAAAKPAVTGLSQLTNVLGSATTREVAGNAAIGGATAAGEAGIDAATGAPRRIGMGDVLQAGAAGGLMAAPFALLGARGQRQAVSQADRAAIAARAEADAAAHEAQAQALENGALLQNRAPLPTSADQLHVVGYTPEGRPIFDEQAPALRPPDGEPVPPFDPNAEIPTTELPRFSDGQIGPPPTDPPPMPPVAPPAPRRPAPVRAPVAPVPEAALPPVAPVPEAALPQAPAAAQAPAAPAPKRTPASRHLDSGKVKAVFIVDESGQAVRVDGISKEADGRWRGVTEDGDAPAFDAADVEAVEYPDGAIFGRDENTNKWGKIRGGKPVAKPAPEPVAPVAKPTPEPVAQAPEPVAQAPEPVAQAPEPAPAVRRAPELESVPAPEPTAPVATLRETLDRAEQESLARKRPTIVQTLDGETFVHHIEDGKDRFYPIDDYGSRESPDVVPRDIAPGRIARVADATNRTHRFDGDRLQAPPKPGAPPAAEGAPVAGGPKKTKTERAAEARAAKAAGKTWVPGDDPRVRGGETSVASADSGKAVLATVIDVQGSVGIQHDPAKGYRVVHALPHGQSNNTKTVTFSPIGRDGKPGKTVGAASALGGKWHATREQAHTEANRLFPEFRPDNGPVVGRAAGLAEVEVAARAASDRRSRDLEPLVRALDKNGYRQSADALTQQHREIEALAQNLKDENGNLDRSVAERIDALRTKTRETAAAMAEEADRARSVGEAPDKSILFGRYGSRGGKEPAPAANAILDGVTTINGALGRVHGDLPPEMQALADTVKARQARDTPVDVHRGLYDGPLPEGVKAEDVPGFFDKKTGRISLYPDAIAGIAERHGVSIAEVMGHSIIHEEVHAQTHQRLDMDTTFRRSVEDTLDAAKAAWDERNPGSSEDPYGFTDPHEFLSEAMGNPNLRKFLASVKDSTGRSLWQKFVGAVSATLRKIGVHVPEQSLLDKAMSAYEYASALPTGGETKTWHTFQATAKQIAPEMQRRFAVMLPPALEKRKWALTEKIMRVVPQSLHVMANDATGLAYKLLERSNHAQQVTAKLDKENAVDFNAFAKVDKVNPKLGVQMLENRAAAARRGRTLKTPDALSALRSQGFSAEDVAAAEALYRTYARDNLERASAFDANAAAASRPEEAKAFRDAADAYRNRALEAYVPLARRADYVVGTPTETRSFSTSHEADAWKAERIAQGEKITRDTVKGDIKFKASGPAKHELERITSVLTESGMPKAEIDDIIDHILPTILDRTALAENLRALGKPGFDTDIRSIVGEGLTRRARSTGRIVAHSDDRFRGLEAAIRDPANGVSGETRKWAENWITDQASPAGADSFVGLLGSSAAITGLMAPATGFANIANQMQAGAMAGFGHDSQMKGMALGVRNTATGFAKILTEILASGTGAVKGTESTGTKFDAANMRVADLTKSGTPEDAALGQAMKKSAASGVLADSETRLHSLEDSGRAGPKKLAALVMWVQNHTTRIARVQTWETGARMWQQMHQDPAFWRRMEMLGYSKGMERADMGRFADWWTTRLEGGYGREHRPEMVRKGLPALAYTFQTYAHNQLNVVTRLATQAETHDERRQAAAALVSYFGSLMVMGGALSALPLGKTAVKLWDTVTGKAEDSLKQIEAKWGKWTTKSILAEAMPAGWLSDVVGSVGERAGLGTAFGSVPGVQIPYQVGKGAVTAAGGLRDMAKGGADYYTGRDAVREGVREIAPQAERYRLAVTGDEVRSGKGNMQASPPSVGERAALALGVAPKRIVEARDTAQAGKPVHGPRLHSLANEIADAVVEENVDRRKAAFAAFNALRKETLTALQEAKSPQERRVLIGRMSELQPSLFASRIQNAVFARRNPRAAAIKNASPGYRPAVAMAGAEEKD